MFVRNVCVKYNIQALFVPINHKHTHTPNKCVKGDKFELKTKKLANKKRTKRKQENTINENEA